VNDKLCEEAVWYTQTMLLGGKRAMEQIAEAAREGAEAFGVVDGVTRAPRRSRCPHESAHRF
jgi:hypothetical protein